MAGVHRGWREGSTHVLVKLVILGVLGGGEWDWDGVEGAVVVEAPLLTTLKTGGRQMHGRLPRLA